MKPVRFRVLPVISLGAAVLNRSHPAKSPERKVAVRPVPYPGVSNYSMVGWRGRPRRHQPDRRQIRRNGRAFVHARLLHARNSPSAVVSILSTCFVSLERSFLAVVLDFSAVLGPLPVYSSATRTAGTLGC